ncbi:hypothetical protein [Pseudonocardia halophobica]|uniref:hypothetical protein n=1 Tax=Pseudonocardia halophobica TaxID=29401 RepID=UPI0012DF3CC0|nr:hypothetical protein [Pseudonocardia halophobica]
MGAALLLAACGGRSEAPQPLPTFAPSYDWALVADVIGDDPDAQVYRAVRTGCDPGQQALNSRWDQLTGPREVLLFAAAIQMCRGDQAGALASYQKASTYGWNGLGPDRMSGRCAVYTALTVTLNRVTPAVVSCPAGLSPAFVRSASGVADNPLTPEDEAAPPVVPPAVPPNSSSRPPTTTAKARSTPTTTATTPSTTTSTRAERAPLATTTKPRPTTAAPAPTTRPKPQPTSQQPARPNTTTKPKPQNPGPTDMGPNDGMTTTKDKSTTPGTGMTGDNEMD